jgi:general secretion pathway protein A
VFDAPPPAAARRGPVPARAGLAVLAAAVAGAGLTWALQRPGPSSGPAVDSMALAASAPSAVASPASATLPAAPASAASAPIPAASTVDLSPQPLSLADWAPRDGDAWTALAQRWGLPLPPQADPCSVAAQRGLQCYRTSSGSLSLVRLIDRPVLLTLRRPGQPAALAALVALEEQQAVLMVDGQPRHVALAELAGAWRGEFVTFWRVPPGYAERADNSTPLREWLAARLAPASPSSAAASAPAPAWPELNRQVQAFQASQGLQPDGLIGPITLMQVNRAAGIAEPRLGLAPNH